MRRLPNETKDEVLARFRQTINDASVEIAVAPGSQAPATDPSSMSTPLFQAMSRAIGRTYPRDVIVPYMGSGASDSSFLRAHGMPVYGVPGFVRDSGESHARMETTNGSPKSVEDEVELLWQIVLEIAGGS